MVFFDSAYQDADRYDTVLPAHFFNGMSDVDLLGVLLREILGPPPDAPSKRLLELGCGSGRMTRQIARYATAVCGVDRSRGMLERFSRAFTNAEVICDDIESAIESLARSGARFDIIGSFWALNYPLLECFEETSRHGVRPVASLADGRARAMTIVHRLLSLLESRGDFFVFFFDSESTEQSFVTSLWEGIAPFPGTGRDYTRALLVEALSDAEAMGVGRLVRRRYEGVVLADGCEAARRWFTAVHLNDFGPLVDDPEVVRRIDDFVRSYELVGGQVALPAGVHVFHFERIASPASEIAPDRAEPC